MVLHNKAPKPRLQYVLVFLSMLSLSNAFAVNRIGPPPSGSTRRTRPTVSTTTSTMERRKNLLARKLEIHQGQVTTAASPLTSSRTRLAMLDGSFTLDLLMDEASKHQIAAESIMLSPDVEAEVLTDAAHVILDFSGIFSPSKSLLRIFSVLGRILVICADYLPDHTVHPEELCIQLFLLAISLQDVIKTQLLLQQHHQQ